MHKVMISLPDEFLKDVDVIAHAEHRNRSELVREAIRAYVAVRHEHRVVAKQSEALKAATRILKAGLRLPDGETTVSMVRALRRSRYGAAAWKSLSSTHR